MEMISFINQSAFYFGAIFVSVSCLIYTAIQNNMDKPHTRIFVMALWIVITNGICDMVAIYVRPYCELLEMARFIRFNANYIYFIFHNMLGMCLCYYVFFATQTFMRMGRIKQTIYLIPWIVSELFVVINPFNHLSWTYDSEYNFVRGIGVYLVYVTGIFYYIIALYYLLFRWYAATKKRKLLIIISFAFTIVGVMLQFFIPNLETELFFEAITFVGLMLSVEYDDDRVDPVTRLFNRNAFIQDTNYYYDTHSRFSAVILRITNYDTYQKMTDAYDINEVVTSLASGLKTVPLIFTPYRVTPSCFVLLVINRDTVYVDNLATKVNALYNDGLNLPQKDERIAGGVVEVDASEDISSVRELLLLCEMEFKRLESGKVMKGDALYEFYDRAGIERAIRDGLSEHNFEVFYQMVYNTKSEEVHSAEALLRLRDPKLGELLPKVFIPAAERNGMIDVLGEFVLRDVCRFIKSGIPEKTGMRYINVNLSVLQCMQPHFVERVENIVVEEGVAPSLICLEITESVAAEDYRYLSMVIEECKVFGFKFSMEGYGSGYSNIYSVFSLDFDEIKLDKTLLWDSDVDEQGRIILENSIRMIHEMRKPVVAVGVETKQQLDKLKMLDVEYVQGFFMSEPKPHGEFE